MNQMAQAEITDRLGRETAATGICLEAYDGVMTMIFCAVAPGAKAKVRIDPLAEEFAEFTSKTGYFAYIKYLGAWDLEKLN